MGENPPDHGEVRQPRGAPPEMTSSGLRKHFDFLYEEGMLTRAIDPHGYALYKYSNRTVFGENWNWYTRSARGLVLSPSGDIVARPFPKFFNLNEHPETRWENLPKGLPELAEKLDGSLIIVFYHSALDAWRAATTGSFDSVQAAWANGWLAAHPEVTSRFAHSYTHLFELTAGWNRIVVAYGEPQLTLLSVIDNQSGTDISYAQTAELAACLGVPAASFLVRPLSSFDPGAPGENAEGFVARFPNGLRVKLKYQSYLLFHRAASNLSRRSLWELLQTGKTDAEVRQILPDFLRDWAQKHLDDLHARFAASFCGLDAAWLSAPKNAPRKDFAKYALRYPPPIRPALFARLDGKPVAPILWKDLEPRGDCDQYMKEKDR